MKRIIGNIVLYVLSLIAVIILGFAYIKVFRISLVAIAVLLAFFFALMIIADNTDDNKCKEKRKNI